MVITLGRPACMAPDRARLSAIPLVPRSAVFESLTLHCFQGVWRRLCSHVHTLCAPCEFPCSSI
jgi:hypothetical protein